MELRYLDKRAVGHIIRTISRYEKEFTICLPDDVIPGYYKISNEWSPIFYVTVKQYICRQLFRELDNQGFIKDDDYLFSIHPKGGTIDIVLHKKIIP